MDTLFHYCSNETFISIISGRNIRLSSLSLSNDSLEGKLPVKLLCELAGQQGIKPYYLPRLQRTIGSVELVVEGLGLCLSEGGDILSQWRAYADDGAGIAIGFAKEHFEETEEALKEQLTKPGGVPGYSLNKIIYEKEIQLESLAPIWNEIEKCISEGALDIPSSQSLIMQAAPDAQERDERIQKAYMHLRFAAISLTTSLFLFKTDAFSEEREWRLISHTTKSDDDPCSYFSRGDRIVPFRSYPLDQIKTPPITQIIKGPKNKTPDYVIEKMLKQNGFADVKISESNATYK